MSFKSWVVPLTLVGSVIIIQFSDVSGNPLTPLNRLPSITIDTLYTEPPPPLDQQESESTNVFRHIISVGRRKFESQFRPRKDEYGYVTLFRLPWRLATGLSSTGYKLARRLMDKATDQAIHTYHDLQRNVIPKVQAQAASAYNEFKVYSLTRPNPETQGWLDGGV